MSGTKKDRKSIYKETDRRSCVPELPEVETVKRGLEEILQGYDESIESITVSKEELRNKLDVKKLKRIKNQKILNVIRKAKYLLFELNDYYIISHLGMTGSWRVEKDKRKHDHIHLHLSSKRTLTYNDPRRFGIFDIINKSALITDTRFTHLGPDPILDSEFTGAYLFKITRKSSMPIKSFIMDQTRVVGVGNIYASEALFLAGIHPMKKANQLSLKKLETLVKAIQQILLQAIESGGTTISDFRQAGGSEGYFQNLLLAYGRDKEMCYFCQSVILSEMLSGRNTFWCAKCQKL